MLCQDVLQEPRFILANEPWRVLWEWSNKHYVLWDLHRGAVSRIYVKRHSKARKELLEGKTQEEDCALHLTSGGEHKTCKTILYSRLWKAYVFHTTLWITSIAHFLLL